MLGKKKKGKWILMALIMLVIAALVLQSKAKQPEIGDIELTNSSVNGWEVIIEKNITELNEVVQFKESKYTACYPVSCEQNDTEAIVNSSNNQTYKMICSNYTDIVRNGTLTVPIYEESIYQVSSEENTYLCSNDSICVICSVYLAVIPETSTAECNSVGYPVIKSGKIINLETDEYEEYN